MLEENIFKNSHVNISKIKKYGFIQSDNKYIYNKNILDNKFKVEISIDERKKINGKIIELETEEEYNNFRIENYIGEFANSIKEEYLKILNDIKDKCYQTDFFIYPQTNRIAKYIIDSYQDKPEFLWNKYPGYGVFRNKFNNKWYAIIMNIDKSKIDKEKGEIEILNIKLNENEINNLIEKKGFYKAYHMNNKNWISISLDNTIKDEEIINLLNESYNNISTPENWIVPANPKYYDILNCFNKTDEIIWKQSTNININDIIYIYVTNSYKEILYKCKVLKTKIPYEYKNKNISMKYVMKIKLLKKYNNKLYTIEFLNKLGIKSIRGPIKISEVISNLLK